MNGATITLASTIRIQKSLAIEGNGITLDGNNACQIMRIDNDATVTLSGLHFANGRASDYGGALDTYFNTTVTLANCIFSGNTATGSGYGGAIITDGTLTVTACTFHNNTAYRGGAMSVSGGTITLAANLFHGNTATDGGDTVYRYSGTVTSLGYNVWDNASENRSGAFNPFTGTGDSNIVTATIDPLTFAPTAAAPRIVPSGVANVPLTDIHGATRTYPAAPGAVAFAGSADAITAFTSAANGDMLLTFPGAAPVTVSVSTNLAAPNGWTDYLEGAPDGVITREQDGRLRVHLAPLNTPPAAFFKVKIGD